MALLRAEALVDISASTGSVFTIDAPRAGYLDINKTFGRWEEATGSQTSVVAVASIEVGGVEIALLTASQSGAIADTQNFLADGTNAIGSNPHVEFSAGDVIDVTLKTQASGGTTTGTLRVYLALDIADVTP